MIRANALVALSMQNFWRRPSAPFLIVMLILGCNDDQPGNIEDELDIELEALLLEADDQGRDHFILPVQEDFASLPQDPKNPITREKVELGRMLFHETALGNDALRSGGLRTYSCSSCHNSSAAMQPGRRQGIAEGGSGFGVKGESRDRNLDYEEVEVDAQPIRAPSTLNVAYQKNVLWNGMFGATGLNEGTEAQWTGDAAVNLLGFEGVESQAIKGLEVHRMSAEMGMMTDFGYLDMLRVAFPGVAEDTLISRTYLGLAIASYVRTITTSEAPFQRWLRGQNSALSDQEKRGAILFFGKAGCVSCHTGPGLNKMDFAAVGMADLTGPDILNKDPFDTPLGRGNFTGNPEDNFKFKIPQLYNLKDASFLGHGSSFENLREVVEYFNQAIPQKELSKASLDEAFKPLGLSDDEIEELTAFLRDGLYDGNLSRHIPQSTLSYSCFPNADEVSKVDLDCN